MRNRRKVKEKNKRKSGGLGSGVFGGTSDIEEREHLVGRVPVKGPDAPRRCIVSKSIVNMPLFVNYRFFNCIRHCACSSQDIY